MRCLKCCSTVNGRLPRCSLAERRRLPPARARIHLRPPILPKQFAGWQIQGAAQASKDAAAADPTNAALLKEYGFTDFEAATYKSDDGRTLKIRAARFADASGAFGAYTFYLQPEMAREEIGDQGASLDQRVLFYRGHILVDAVFSQVSVMSAAGLRELAGALPRPSGNAGNLPPILAFMPHHGYSANTEKYAEGPLASGRDRISASRRPGRFQRQPRSSAWAVLHARRRQPR